MRAGLGSRPVVAKSSASSAAERPITEAGALIFLLFAGGGDLVERGRNPGQGIIVPRQRPARRGAGHAHVRATLHGIDQSLFVGRIFDPSPARLAVILDEQIELVRADLNLNLGAELVLVTGNDRGLVPHLAAGPGRNQEEHRIAGRIGGIHLLGLRQSVAKSLIASADRINMPIPEAVEQRGLLLYGHSRAHPKADKGGQERNRVEFRMHRTPPYVSSASA